MSIEQRGIVEHSVTLTDDGRKAKRNIVYFCTDGESLSQVMNSPGFPKIGSEFPEISGLYCKEIILKPERDGRKSKVLAECNYGTVSTGTASEEEFSYGKAFQFKVLPVETKVPFYYSYDKVDAEGRPIKPVCSSAGEFFDLETTEITMLLRFSYYARSFSPEWILNFCNTTNKKTIRVCGIEIKKDCGLLRSLCAEGVEINGKTEIKVNVELEVNPSGFLRIVPNRGYYCWTGTHYSRICYGISKTTQEIHFASMKNMLEERDENAPVIPVDSPAWLNSDGSVRIMQTSLLNGPLLSFREKRSTDWSALSLPGGKPW